jgi:hypothetical protein
VSFREDKAVVAVAGARGCRRASLFTWYFGEDGAIMQWKMLMANVPNVRIMTDPFTTLGLAKTGLVALGAMEQKSMWRDSSNEAEYATSDTGWCQMELTRYFRNRKDVPKVRRSLLR